MSTYNELTSQILDELKLVSDDSHFVEEHIVFLLDKYRVFLLKQRYSDIKKEIPESNYQTICVDLESTTGTNGLSLSGNYLKSVNPIPYMMEIGAKKITPTDFFAGNINYVSSSRFKYAGSSRYSNNQIFGTIAPDHYLYIKSCNSQAYHLKQVKLTGIFEDASVGFEYQCADANGNKECDIMNAEFPIEESLVIPMIQMVIQELSGLKYNAADSKNNANDDLSDLAQYIRQQLALGRRSDLYQNP